MGTEISSVIIYIYSEFYYKKVLLGLQNQQSTVIANNYINTYSDIAIFNE